MAEKKLSGEVYYPSKEVIEYANAKCESLYDFASKDPIGFWEKEAKNLFWNKPWNKVLDDSNKPFYRWFVGAETNIAYNCLDIHIKTARRNKLALIWEGEDGEFRSYSYFKLHRETCRFANVLKRLKSLDVKKVIELPYIWEEFLS